MDVLNEIQLTQKVITHYEKLLKKEAKELYFVSLAIAKWELNILVQRLEVLKSGKKRTLPKMYLHVTH